LSTFIVCTPNQNIFKSLVKDPLMDMLCYIREVKKYIEKFNRKIG